MTPYSHRASCALCQTELTLSAVRDCFEPRTKTAFTVRCPACHNEVHGQIPLSIMVASVQIVSYERPVKKAKQRASAG